MTSTQTLHGTRSPIDIIAIPAFEDNIIWLLRQGSMCIALDPGEANPLLAVLSAPGVHLAALLITHHHADHCGGLPDIIAHYPVPIYGPAQENIEGITHPLSGGETLHLPGIDLALTVLAVPGHTRGHLAYLLGRSTDRPPALFCGDTLFGAGCGRLFEGTPSQLLDALTRFSALPPDTLIYCAHEYTLRNLGFARAVEPHNSAIAQRTAADSARRDQGLYTLPCPLSLEQATNPFLRCTHPDVIHAVSSFLGHRPASLLETFTALRAWRDVFS
jgi:hydroxyacylglutathione hydrolase